MGRRWVFLYGLAVFVLCVFLGTCSVFANSDEGSGTVADGVYTISTKLSPSKVLDISGGSWRILANLQIYSANGTDAQKFLVTNLGDNVYSIVSYNSGHSLDVAGAGKTNGTNVSQYFRNGTDAQKFRIESAGDGWMTIHPLCSDLVLDVACGGTGDGTNVWTYAENGSDAQKFHFEKAENKTPLSGGTYLIHSKIDTNMVLTVASGSTDSAANIELRRNSQSNSQYFTVTPEGDGFYILSPVVSALAADAAGASSEDGTNVQQYTPNGTKAQKWLIRENENGYFVIASGTAASGNITEGSVLDLSDRSAGDGANVLLNSANGSASQQFSFEKADGDRNFPESCFTAASTLDSGKVLDVSGAGRGNWTNIQIWSSNNTNAQKFILQYQGDGYYSMMNVNSWKAADVYGAGTASGTNVQQYTENHSAAQKWKFRYNSADGSYTIISALSPSLVLDVSGGATKDGTNVQIYSSNNSAAQKWKLLSVQYTEGGSATYHMDAACQGTTCTFTLQKFFAGRTDTIFSCNGYIGRNGVGKTAEGDGKTPLGTFTVGKAYGILANPGSRISYTRLDSTMYWCGDSASPYYNKFVTTTSGYTPTGNDEHLIDETGSYNYLLDIGYNPEGTPYKGSAIFLHCSMNRPTAGCIAIPENYMQQVLKTITAGSTITIH